MANLPMSEVENWVRLTVGTFTLADARKGIGIESPEADANLRRYLSRLVEKDILVRISGKDGVYRLVDNTVEEINLTNVDLESKVALKLPFDIHKYVTFYPKNVILVAGEGNSGKTAFLYNIAVLNRQNFQVDFFTNNEASPQEIVQRIQAFNIEMPPAFKVYERYDNFGDVVKPNSITIIDYLDLNSEVYLAAEEIKNIQSKLGNGVAVIGMQLPPPTVTIYKGQKKLIHRELAYGGAFTEKRPVLYLNLWNNGQQNHGICRIKKAKNRAQRNIDPNNMQWEYTIDSFGATFEKWDRYHEEDEYYDR